MAISIRHFAVLLRQQVGWLVGWSSTSLFSPTIPSIYCWTSLVSRSSIRPLEFLATGHSVIALITYFPSTAQDISFSKILPPHFIMTFCSHSTRFRGLCNSFTIWATLKIAIDIDIDIDIDKYGYNRDVDIETATQPISVTCSLICNLAAVIV